WVVDAKGEGKRSHAVGTAPLLHFAAPTLAAVNAVPPGGDTTTSFFIEDGGVRDGLIRLQREGGVYAVRLTRSDPCLLDAAGPRKRAVIVTAVTATGFYVTDLSEPAHPTLPGHFGHLFVYNFNFPEGLRPGARLHFLE